MHFAEFTLHLHDVKGNYNKIHVNKFYCFIQFSKTLCLACLPKQGGANHSYL